MLDITDDFNYYGEGIAGIAIKNTTTNIDFKIENEKCYIQSGEVIFKDAVWGDFIKVEVVDKDGIIYDAGAIVKTYIPKLYIHPDLKIARMCSSAAALIPNGFYLRAKYTSVGTTTDVKVEINYHLHLMDT